MPLLHVLADWVGAVYGIQDSSIDSLLTVFPNQMEKENNRDVSKGLKVSIHSHSRGLDGLWQAARLLSRYPK